MCGKREEKFSQTENYHRNFLVLFYAWLALNFVMATVMVWLISRLKFASHHNFPKE